MEIVTKIDQILLEKGMTLENLLEKTGLPRMTIFNARRGKNVKIGTAVLISKALEVPLEQIWEVDNIETTELEAENSNLSTS